jgi:glycosyltransferase involved in cell wall biosynthesis
MKISVIIPAFNEEKLLASSLARIREAASVFAERGWWSEVIVCDNNSTDGTAEIARAAGAMVVAEPVNQISRARNRGASVARGDWLVFVDADSWPSRRLFEALSRRIETGKVVGGGCTIAMDGGGLMIHALGGVWNTISRVCRLAAGSFVFCEAEAFRAVGGFSLELYASEEIDLSKKLKAHGRKGRKRFDIISEASLLTSARRGTMYSLREHLRFARKVLKSPQASVKDQKACGMWYDGRR